MVPHGCMHLTTQRQGTFSPFQAAVLLQRTIESYYITAAKIAEIDLADCRSNTFWYIAVRQKRRFSTVRNSQTVGAFLPASMFGLAAGSLGTILHAACTTYELSVWEYVMMDGLMAT